MGCNCSRPGSEWGKPLFTAAMAQSILSPRASEPAFLLSKTLQQSAAMQLLLKSDLLQALPALLVPTYGWMQPGGFASFCTDRGVEAAENALANRFLLEVEAAAGTSITSESRPSLFGPEGGPPSGTRDPEVVQDGSRVIFVGDQIGRTRLVGFRSRLDFRDVAGPWVRQEVWTLAIGYGWDCETITAACLSYVDEVFQVFAPDSFSPAPLGTRGNTYSKTAASTGDLPTRNNIAQGKFPGADKLAPTDTNRFVVDVNKCGVCKLWVLVLKKATDGCTVSPAPPGTYAVLRKENLSLGCLNCDPVDQPATGGEATCTGAPWYKTKRFLWEICESCKLREPGDPEPPPPVPIDPTPPSSPPPTAPPTTPPVRGDLGGKAKTRFLEGNGATESPKEWFKRSLPNAPAPPEPPASPPAPPITPPPSTEYGPGDRPSMAKEGYPAKPAPSDPPPPAFPGAPGLPLPRSPR